MWNHETGTWHGSRAQSTEPEENLPESLYLFGYGSLCWKPGDLSELEQTPAVLFNHIRRFHQKSTDHRGTPKAPGLVATIQKSISDKDSVFGVAFKLPPPGEERNELLSLLDFREKGGYSRSLTKIRLMSGRESITIVDALVYIGLENNPHFLDDNLQTIDHVSRIISKAEGPSGTNIEYFQNLYEFLKQNDQQDEYMENLNSHLKFK
eukprot:maker-scaffold_2-snap-gene-0.1-mRNA-1 protein AED:0.02 eAED:0.02 QI:49/1/1/1/1/1/2/9/207